MKTVLSLLLLVGLLHASSQQPRNYTIGFKTINTYDWSQNHSDSLHLPLPVQISVWYPSQSSDSLMIYSDYLTLTQRGSENFHFLNQDGKRKKIEEYKEVKLNLGVEDQSLEKILNYPMRAELNHHQLSESFP